MSIVLPTCRPSRSASTKLAVASPTASGRARRPASIFQRSTSVPTRLSSDATGNTVVASSVRPVSVRPLNGSATKARALRSTNPDRATASRSTPPTRPKVLYPVITTSTAACPSAKRSYAFSLRRAACASAIDVPAANPMISASPIHARHR